MLQYNLHIHTELEKMLRYPGAYVVPHTLHPVLFLCCSEKVLKISAKRREVLSAFGFGLYADSSGNIFPVLILLPDFALGCLF